MGGITALIGVIIIIIIMDGEIIGDGDPILVLEPVIGFLDFK
jgi:hypothetical protein